MSNTRGKLPNSPEILYLTIAAWCFGVLVALGAIGIVYQIAKLIVLWTNG